MLFVVWTGKRWILPVAFFPVALFTEVVVEQAASDDQFYRDHLWCISIVFLVMAAMAFAVHRSERPPVAMVGSVPARRSGLRPAQSSFMAIPVRYWTLMLTAGAIILAVVDVLRAGGDAGSSARSVIAFVR